MEAEISVLGAMLQDSTAVLRAIEQLKAEDFYQPEHKAIYEAMLMLAANHSPIDLVTLHTELAREGTLDGVGGDAYLMRILNSVPTSANVKAYIDIVAQKSTLRKLIQASQKISGECYSQQDPVEQRMKDKKNVVIAVLAVLALVFAILFISGNSDKGALEDAKKSRSPSREG